MLEQEEEDLPLNALAILDRELGDVGEKNALCRTRRRG